MFYCKLSFITTITRVVQLDLKCTMEFQDEIMALVVDGVGDVGKLLLEHEDQKDRVSVITTLKHQPFMFYK